MGWARIYGNRRREAMAVWVISGLGSQVPYRQQFGLGWPPVFRVWGRCYRAESGCLVWTGPVSDTGYGYTSVDRKVIKVHRLVYEHFYGAIPEGLVIDHVRSRGCVHTACCEPTHLEAVTPRENWLRGRAPSVAMAQRTHCQNGHALVDGNLTTAGVKRGIRECKICTRAKNTAWARRRRATESGNGHRTQDGQHA